MLARTKRGFVPVQLHIHVHTHIYKTHSCVECGLYSQHWRPLGLFPCSLSSPWLGDIIFSRKTSGPDLLAALMGNVLLGLIIFTVKKVHLDFTV